jgi:hypothetical protein
MDFLHGGLTGCAGLIIGYSEGGGGEEWDSVEEVDNTLRVRACALSRGQLGITERLRLAGESFLTVLLRFSRNRIVLSPLTCLTWLIAALTTSSGLDSFDWGCVAGLLLAGRVLTCAGKILSPWVTRAVFLGVDRKLGTIVMTISKKVWFYNYWVWISANIYF